MVLDAFERSARLADVERHRHQEYDAQADALLARIREGVMPPNDLRAWARILVDTAESVGLLVKGWDE